MDPSGDCILHFRHLFLTSIETTVSNTDDVQLESWKRLGILPAAFFPAHADNLILLCKACHSAYDVAYAAWITIPHNLDFFINFEKKDYAARAAAARRGVEQGRALPEVPFVHSSNLLSC